jgi:carboxyl-terminal processing protease
MATAALILAAAPLSPEKRRLNLESFDYVWKTVRDKHWDPKLGGIDWEAVRDELRPKMEAAATDDDSRKVMGDMLQRLHQTHFGVIPADAYQTLHGKADGSAGPSDPVGAGQTGIEVQIASGRAIVTSVAPDSAAQTVGVQPGWAVVRVDHTEIAPIINRLSGISENPRNAELMIARAVRGRLDGDVGTEVTVEFHDINQKAITKKMTRRVEPGELTRFGFLPPMVVRIESKKLAGGAEYIRFNLFLQPDIVVTRFGEAIHECGHCPGVIIDLRGNPGGIGAMAMGMTGFLISKPDQKLGMMYLRSLPVRFVIFPRAEVYDGPVAVLVDGFTASTSEILAGGLQDLKRARIFGQRTAGAALPSQIEKLPNGDGFQYAVANYISEGGRQLEGNGVTPDVEVPFDRKALSEGRDPVLEAALAWVRQRQKGDKK